MKNNHQQNEVNAYDVAKGTATQCPISFSLLFFLFFLLITFKNLSSRSITMRKDDDDDEDD
jgi:hypothetical protein